MKEIKFVQDNYLEMIPPQKQVKISKKDIRTIKKASPLIVQKNKSSNDDVFINELTASRYLREALESHKKISTIFNEIHPTMPHIKHICDSHTR